MAGKRAARPKVAQELLDLIRQGIVALGRDMQNEPGDAQVQQYEEKDAYFAGAQKLVGQELYDAEVLPTPHLPVRVRLSGLAEAYYQAMLDYTIGYESVTGKPPYNKGMVYANLGIAQLSQGNLEQGLANLLRTDEEDKRWRGKYSILGMDLWKQFEEPFIFVSFKKHAKRAKASPQFTQQAVEDLRAGLRVPDWLLLVGTLWSIKYNLDPSRGPVTVYTRGRLYFYLLHLCVLTETLIRRQAIAKGLFRNRTVTLCPLLQKTSSALGVRPFQPGKEPKLKAKDMQSLIKGLRYALDPSFVFAERAMRCLYVMRNYAGHHFDVSLPPVDVQGQPLHDDLFDLYEDVLAHVATLLLYLKAEALI